MRKLMGCAVLALLSTTALAATPKWVHLDDAAELEQLRATNFDHYLRARDIIAAANELCQPGVGHSYPARFAADRVSCESMMWMTSNPPKKLLTFQLDDTVYLAVVAVAVSGPRFVGGPDLASPLR